MQHRWPALALLAIVVLTGCLGGQAGDGSGDAASMTAEELRNASLATEPPSTYRFSSHTRIRMEQVSALGDSVDRTTLDFAANGTGAVDRKAGVVRGTWTVERGFDLDTSRMDFSHDVATVVGAGHFYKTGGTAIIEGWDRSVLEQDPMAFDQLAAVRALLANASVRPLETAKGNASGRAVALTVAERDHERALSAALAHYDLASSAVLTRDAFQDLDVDAVNATVWIDSASHRIQRVRLMVNTSELQYSAGQSSVDVAATTSYRGYGDAVNTTLPNVSDHDPIYDLDDQRKVADPEVAVVYGADEDAVTVTYERGLVADNVTVTFSGWGDEAAARLETEGDTARLDTEGLRVNGSATVTDDASPPPHDGERVTVEVTAVRGNRSSVVQREQGEL